MSQEITNQEILEAINIFSTSVEERFCSLEKDVSEIKNDISVLKNDVSDLKNQVSDIKGTINTQMVTKDYLDNKNSDLRGDMVVLTRKEDMKFKRLVAILEKRSLITENEAKEIMSMEPFPQLAL
jgi:septal ring factor EnvC (AmiA/AmiB activator)